MTTSLNYKKNTFNKLEWLLLHYNEEPCLNDLTKPKLARTFSTYGCLPNEYDPLWTEEFKVLKSFFKHWDLTENDITNLLPKIINRPAFKDVLIYLAICDLKILQLYQTSILSWFEKPVNEYDDRIPYLIDIFQLITTFFKSSTVY